MELYHKYYLFNLLALGYEPLETMEVDERVAARKQRYLRLFQKFNFFGFG